MIPEPLATNTLPTHKPPDQQIHIPTVSERKRSLGCCRALCENLLCFKPYFVESKMTTFPLYLPLIVRHLSA